MSGRVKNCCETVGSQFLPRDIKVSRRALWEGVKREGWSPTQGSRGFEPISGLGSQPTSTESTETQVFNTPQRRRVCPPLRFQGFVNGGFQTVVRVLCRANFPTPFYQRAAKWGVRSVVVEFGVFGAPRFSVQRSPTLLKIGIWGPLD